jgi:hypothetical protein
MIFDRQKERIATLAAAIEQDTARMRLRREEAVAATRKAAGTPLGLVACFVAGLVAAPLLGAAVGASRSRLGVRALAAAAAWGWQALARTRAAPETSANAVAGPSANTPPAGGPDQR